MKKIIAAILTITMLFAIVGCGSKPAGNSADVPTPENPLVLKLGHMGSETNPMMRYTNNFKDRVEEATNGAIQIEVYGDKVLGTDREMLEQVQNGTLDMSVNTTSVLSNFIPAYASLDLPYLISDWDQCYKFMDNDIYKDLLAEGQDSGITTLSLAGRGFRHVTTNDHPVRGLADMKGLKLRVIESSVFVDTFEAFGASPQAMSFGEVITALQQGTIDGHENSYAIIQEEHVYEVQNMISETAHMFAFFNMVINTNILNSLPEDMQQIIRDAALAAGLEETQAEQAEEQQVKEFLQTQGVTVIEDVNVDELKSVVQPVYDKFGETNDLKYLEGIQALAE